MLVLNGQVADPPARNREGSLHPRGCRGWDENVEASTFEIGLAARQIRRLDQHDARALRSTPPIRGIGVEDDSTGADLGDGICPGADPAAGAGPRVDDREHGMGQHRQKRCVGLKEVDLHGSGVGSKDLLDDAGGAMAWFGTTMRSRLSATCREVSGVPSWKRTPSRSRKVQESPSRETVHVRARPGSMSLDPSRYRTMVSNTCREIKGTEPSIAVAGSRATGMDGSPTLRGTPCATAKARRARAANIASTTTPLRRSMTSLLISNACGHTSNAPSRGTGVHCFDSPLLPMKNSRPIWVVSVFQCQWHQTCLRTG